MVSCCVTITLVKSREARQKWVARLDLQSSLSIQMSINLNSLACANGKKVSMEKRMLKNVATRARILKMVRIAFYATMLVMLNDHHLAA